MQSKITPAQIKMIHTLKGALGLTDLQYRAALERFHVFSSTQLSEAQADQFVSELQSLAVQAGKWDRPWNKYQNLAGRKGMATPRQLRMIEAMWADVSRAPNAAAREAALLVFLRRFEINGLADIRYYDVRGIVSALTAMRGAA
ncbi:MAG: phage protein GemA/Gp16 family protein [Elusimicrobiales bacterium]